VERQASPAIEQAYDARQKCARATSEANRHKRLHHYDPAHHACEQAIALYDHLAMLLHLLREALQLCSPHGRLRTQQDVRSALTRLFDMIAERDCAAVATALTPIRTHLDDMFVPCAHAEARATALRAMGPHEACEFLVLAGHYAHLVSQAQAKHKRAPQRERACWLAGAAGLVGDEFDTLPALVGDKLDSLVRASSLVAMVTALMRPSLHSCTGQLTQATFKVIMFSHHHRRYKSGKRQGTAPIALVTGKP